MPPSGPPPLDPLSGVLGAVLTPFDDDGRVDGAALRGELDALVDHCDAVSVLAAEVSEYRALRDADRRAALREAIGGVDGRVPVLAGVSAPSLAETAELAELVADLGADYAQVLLPRRPWGGDPSPDELVRFVEAVVSSSPLPVVLYHNPGFGADPSLEALQAACAVPGVVAIKDSSREISRVLRAVQLIELAGHARYFATIQPLLAVLLAGGAGAMTPPPATLVAARIRDAVRDGRLADAAELARLVAIFPGAWSHRHGLTPVMKAACERLGLPLGGPSAPYAPIAGDDREALEAELAHWPTLSPTR